MKPDFDTKRGKSARHKADRISRSIVLFDLSDFYFEFLFCKPLFLSRDFFSMWSNNSAIFQAYRRRWYILFSFSMLSLLQCAVWNTFGPIYESVKYAYDWSDATVALQANWGTFTFIIIVFPLCWLLEKYGLRITTIVVSTLVTFGATLRFVTTNVTVFSIFANICSILNGFAGMLSNLYL